MVNAGKIRGIDGNIDTIPEELKERLKNRDIMWGDVEWIIDRYEQLQMVLEGLSRKIINIEINMGGIVTITQSIPEIQAVHLTTTDVTNDTLITKGSPEDFAWYDPRTKDVSIVPAPGQGVTPWVLLMDTVHNIESLTGFKSGMAIDITDRDGICLPVPDEPTHLQRYAWDASKVLKPKAWPLGWRVDLRQQIAKELPPL
jgi:hypothetical protein